MDGDSEGLLRGKNGNCAIWFSMEVWDPDGNSFGDMARSVNRFQGGRPVYLCENCHRIGVGHSGAWCFQCSISTKPVSLWAAFRRWFRDLLGL